MALEVEMTALAPIATEPVRRWIPHGAPGLEAAGGAPTESSGVAGRAVFCRYEIRAHSQRVQAYATRIARGLGLAGARLEVLRRGALLHDIGKFLLPAALLGKPGDLTPAEWATIRRHPLVGYMLLQDRADLADASEIVYAHHERFDGTGYPRGLAGEAIPLGARIVTVADVFAAMTSPRAYHAPQPIARAREGIAGGAGAHFDPDMVQAFLSIPAAEWETLAPGPSAGPWSWPFSAFADARVRTGQA
jgi:putative nucleotidyltransferase with HDIG domain